MSGLVYAGSAQFVALRLWASALPVLSLVLTTLTVNLRLLLMGAVLGRWFAQLPAPEEKADACPEYLQGTGLKEYRATEGNAGALVLQRFHGGMAKFLLISLWVSLDSIHAFAGEDIEQAVYYPEDEEYQREPEPEVPHYEVLGGRGLRGGRSEEV